MLQKNEKSGSLKAVVFVDTWYYFGGRFRWSNLFFSFLFGITDAVFILVDALRRHGIHHLLLHVAHPVLVTVLAGLWGSVVYELCDLLNNGMEGSLLIGETFSYFIVIQNLYFS